MSRYFETLKRLQAGSSGARSKIVPVRDLEQEEPQTGLEPFARVSLQSAQARRAFSGLLESLRLAAASTLSRSVVVAGVSDDQASRYVMAGLETVVADGGPELVTGELTVAGGERSIQLRPVSAGSHQAVDATAPGAAGTAALDLVGTLQPETLLARIEQVNARVEAAVLHAPPLALSAEAALLAQAAGGIALILEPLTTPRSDLFRALDRAEQSGCRILGVVTVGATTTLPRWLRRSLDDAG